MEDLELAVKYKNKAHSDLSYLAGVEVGQMFTVEQMNDFALQMGVPVVALGENEINVRRCDLKTRTVSFRFLLKKKADVSRFSTDSYQLESMNAHIEPVQSSVILMMQNEPNGEWEAGSVATLASYTTAVKGGAWYARFEDGVERLLNGEHCRALVLINPQGS